MIILRVVLNWIGWNISYKSFSIAQCHVNIVRWRSVNLNFAHCFEIDCKSWALIDFTRNFDRPTHLFNDGFTNGKSKSTTLWVLLPMLIKVSKVHKKWSEFVFWYPYTKVLNTQFEANVGSPFCNRVCSLNYFQDTFITITFNSIILWWVSYVRLLSLTY